jgi:hypothetical protein
MNILIDEKGDTSILFENWNTFLFAPRSSCPLEDFGYGCEAIIEIVYYLDASETSRPRLMRSLLSLTSSYM